MSYIRVVPRDLFNEADLLKMLGKLVIHIMEKPTAVPWSYEHEEEHKGFRIEQDEGDGSISCVNLHFRIAGETVYLRRPLNTKNQWSLVAIFRGEEYYIFDSKGNVVPNFGYVR